MKCFAVFITRSVKSVKVSGTRRRKNHGNLHPRAATEPWRGDQSTGYAWHGRAGADGGGSDMTALWRRRQSMAENEHMPESGGMAISNIDEYRH